jgi:hypothetical protein
VLLNLLAERFLLAVFAAIVQLHALAIRNPTID